MTAAIAIPIRAVGAGAVALGRGAVRVSGIRTAQVANTRLAPNVARNTQRRAGELGPNALRALRAAARARGGQAALMVPTIRQTNTARTSTNEFQVARFTAGGSLLVGRRHVAAQYLIFGGEFGSTAFTQFPARLRAGYWFFRTVEATHTKGSLEGPAADDAVRQWAGPSQQYD